MRYLYQIVFTIGIMALTMSLTSSLFGQNLDQRLRVTLAGSTVIGTVTSNSSSSFELNLPDGGSRLVMYEKIRRLERSLGTRNYMKEGALIGIGIGAAAGVLYGLLHHETCDLLTLGNAEEECDEIGIKTTVLSAAAWGGGLGLGGLIIGVLVRREEWATIRRPYGSGLSRVSPIFNVVFGQKGNPKVVLGARITF